MIAIASKPSLQTQLLNAEQQEKLLNKQYFDACKALEALDVGAPEHLEQSTLAADITRKISAVRAEIEQLKQSLKTEAERQQEADALAARQAKALDVASAKALDEVGAAITRINTASDELVSALKQYDELKSQHSAVLRQSGKLNFRDINRRMRTILMELPYCTRQSKVARLQRRHEAGLKD